MHAARPATLSAAIVPVLVGSAAAQAEGAFRPLVFAAALVASLLIQVGTNFANDLFDFKKGADTAGRLGPTRVTQAGLLSEAAVARGAGAAFGLAACAGLYLVLVGGWPILLVGLLAIASGVLYTGGPWPIGYHGLGDLFTFVFFGVVGVVGTYYVHTDAVSWASLALSLPVGLLVTAILMVNNLRDIDTDRRAGKRTLAVRLGARATRLQYALFLALAYAFPLTFRLAGISGSWFWLPWLTLPLGIRLVRRVLADEGPALNLCLKGTARLHLWFGLLLSLSLLG